MLKNKIDYFDYLTKTEEENIQKTKKYFSKELEFWKESFNMLFDAFKSVSNSYSGKWSYSKKASFFILPRLIMSSKTSLDLLIRGYYFDSIVINRSLIESVALLTLFLKDEATAQKWLDFEKLEVPKWKLIHKMVSAPTKKQLKLANKMYAEQSDFVHSNAMAIFAEWKRHLTHKRVLKFPKFIKSLVGVALSCPLSLLINLCLLEVFKEELEDGFRKKVIDLTKERISNWELKDT